MRQLILHRVLQLIENNSSISSLVVNFLVDVDEAKEEHTNGIKLKIFKRIMPLQAQTFNLSSVKHVETDHEPKQGSRC
jgi:hypothetical protein